MNNNIILGQLSENFPLPRWWIEYVIVEYLNCRHYFITDQIWKIDYNLLSREDVSSIFKYKIIIPTGSTLYHNIDQGELKERISSVLTGKKLTSSISDNIIVEGIANKPCFVLHANSFDDWDPKLSFNERCIILDAGNFYQWKIAEIKEGKWESDIVNLKELEKVNDKIINLKDLLETTKLGRYEARILARKLYRELENIRSRIRKDILKFHKTKIINMY